MEIDIYHNGTWGGIYWLGLGGSAANVICRQLGYAYATARCSYTGNSNKFLWIERAYCSGCENNIISCNNKWKPAFSSDVLTAGVKCSGTSTYICFVYYY